MGKQITMSAEAYRWLKKQPKPVRQYIEALLAKGWTLKKQVGSSDYKVVAPKGKLR